MDKNATDQNYDLRQHTLMLKMIEDYQNGSIELGQLVTNLEALRSVLVNPTKSWLTQFEPAWGKLEDVYASMLDEHRTSFDATDRRLIAEGVSRLASLESSEIAKRNQTNRDES